MIDTVLGMPSRGDVQAWTLLSVLQSLRYDRLRKGRIADLPIMPTGTRIDEGRNAIVRNFLDETDAKWLWFCDDDQSFSGDDIYTLLDKAEEHDLKVASAFTCGVTMEGRAIPTSHIRQGHDADGSPLWAGVIPLEPDENTEPMPMDSVGTGFLIIRRDVLVEIEKEYSSRDFPWFEFQGRKGEDNVFCERLEEIGIVPYVVPQVRVGHIKTVNFVPHYAAKEAVSV